MKGRPWLLALLGNLAVAGISRVAFLSDLRVGGRYFLAIAITLFSAVLTAVVLGVWQERPGLAGPFVLLVGSLAALLFYRQELSSQLPLAELIIGIVTLVSWVLTVIGCQLRRRLRTMD